MREALFETMARQVAQRCEQIIGAAEEEAKSIVSEAQRTAQRRHDAAVAQVKREVERLAARARELAAVKAEHDALTMQQEVANEVLGQVEGELKGLAQSPRFPEILDALLAEIMANAPKDAVVLAPVAHEQRCREWIRSHGYSDVSVQASPYLVDGVAMQDAQRTYRVTNTLSSRFQKVKNDARKVCMRTLFGAEAG
jgi:vacuolar-type H+-ATPase subunit E/Vma4